MKKLLTVLLCFTTIATASISALAEKLHETVDFAGVGIINDAYTGIDYKAEKSLDSFWIELGLPSRREDLTAEGSTNLSELSKEESWLVDNDIVSRLFTLTDSKVNSTNYEPDTNCPKTLLYTMLYRAYYGKLESRNLVFNTAAHRQGSYVTEIPSYIETEEVIIDASFKYGDNWLYVSSNVYELYLKDLLDKGIITKDLFDDAKGALFLADYNRLSEATYTDANISWDNRNALINSDTSSVLGYSHDYGITDNVITITENAPNYFKDENMFMLDALNLIAEFVRYAEKDMSALESSIVSYKYGIHYLDSVSEKDRENIEFLIAKGILDFEHPEEFVNLYGEFTYEDAIKLIYRVANVDARLDFSEVTLTDTESFWMSEGYYANNMTVKQSTSLPNVETITEEYWKQLIKEDAKATDDDDASDETTESHDMFIDELLGVNLSDVYSVKAADMSLFTVVKMFDTSYDYQYKGIAINELEDSESRPEEFVSYEEKNFESIGSGEPTTLAKVTFSVEARDFDTAVLYVDNNITIQGGVSSSDVYAYTTITEDGEEITLIPASSLRASFSDIAIIEDKVLMNNVTGVTAVILEEEGYALVGNRVVTSNTLMMTDTSEEVYYNLDVICTLLRNTYLSKLTDRELYICSSLNSEKATPVISSNGNEIGKTYTVKVTVKEEADAADNEKFSKTRFYNIDNLNKGINVLSKKFDIVSGDTLKNVFVVVNWEYVVPDVETLATFLDNDFLGNDSTLTLNDVNNALYTRPTDKSLQEWWDSNISVSNSLANFMYGTTGVEYIKSGYLVPNLVILRDTTIPDSAISSIFTHYGFKLDSVGLKYCKSTTNWWKNYYSASTMSDEYMKALAIANRTCEVLNGSVVTDGVLFDDKYFVTKAGVIYKNLEFDNLLTYKSSDKSIHLKTRNLKGGATIAENTGFTYNGRNWLYAYTTRVGNRLYYVVQPNFALDKFQNVSVINTKQYGILINTDTDSKKSDNQLYLSNVSLINSVYSKYFGDSVKPMSSYQDSSYMFGASTMRITGFFDLLYDTGSYYLAGNRLINGAGDAYNPPINTTIDKYNSMPINCIPLLYVPADKFYFSGEEGDYQMIKGTLATALGMNNVFTAGIAQSVIDSIINRYTKTIPVNSMITGQRVLITDIMFTRTTDEHGNAILLSDPIKNSRLVAAMKNSEREFETDVIKRLLFTGIKVNYGGQDYYLSSFIKKANLGDLSNPVDNVGVLYYRNGNKYVYLDAEHQKQSVDSLNPKAVCIAIQLHDGLMARPTNEKQNTYTMLMVSSVASDTTVDDIPFFNEELSYSEKLADYVTVEKSVFNPSSLYTKTKKSFKSMMAEAFAGDLVTILWMFIFYFSVYMAIMSWIAFFILTLGYGHRIFEAFTIPVKNNGYVRRGFDLIKIFTFGIYNIDSEPTMARTFISSFVCFFIAFAIVFWRPF